MHDGRMDGWMDGRTDGWTEGWMDGCVYIGSAAAPENGDGSPRKGAASQWHNRYPVQQLPAQVAEDMVAAGVPTMLVREVGECIDVLNHYKPRDGAWTAAVFREVLGDCIGALQRVQSFLDESITRVARVPPDDEQRELRQLLMQTVRKVWWQGQRIRERDEVLAAQGGAHVHFRRSWTAHRNYCASELEFFNTWGEKEPCDKVKPGAGEGYTYCGCQKSIHAVRGVRWGSRMVLLVWTRPKGSKPAGEAGTCYFKPGSGPSIWLTSEDSCRDSDLNLESRCRQSRREGRNVNKTGLSRTPWHALAAGGQL
eukprot:s75_g19.t1